MSETTITAPTDATTPPAPVAPALDPAAAAALLAAIREAVAVAPAPAPAAAPSSTPTPAPTAARIAVGSLVEFDTVDSITNERVHGFGIVRGHVVDVDENNEPVGALRTKVTPLPNDYVLVVDDELVAEH